MQEQKPQDVLVLYHGNCPDGFGAALAAWKKFGDAATYMPVNYGEPAVSLELVKDRHVYLLDFTYPRNVLILFKACAKSLTIIDHHKTAAEDLRDFPGAIFDMEHSGAMLAWKHFFPAQAAPLLFAYIEDRDLWRWELPNSHAVSLALWALPREFSAWSGAVVSTLSEKGRAMQDYQRALVDQMCKQSFWVILSGHRVPCACASVCFSEVPDELLRRYPDAPFAAYYFDRGDGMRQWGLRSRKGFDVSAVAKEYGGGGHAAAAGFSTPTPPVLLSGPVHRTVKVVGNPADPREFCVTDRDGVVIDCMAVDIRVAAEDLSKAVLHHLDGKKELVELE